MKEKNSFRLKWGIGITIIIMFIIVYLNKGSIYILLTQGNLNDLVLFIRSYGKLAPLLSILLMVLQAFIAPIPSFMIAGANGLVFGTLGGVIISWIGAMFGAAGTFYLSRTFGEPFVKRFEKSLQLEEKVEQLSKNHGAFAIFIGRLLPFISFDLLSYAAGLSQIKASHFFIATGFGMIPGTIAYVLIGQGLGEKIAYSSGIWPAVGIGIVLYVLYLIIKKNKSDKKSRSSNE